MEANNRWRSLGLVNRETGQRVAAALLRGLQLNGFV